MQWFMLLERKSGVKSLHNPFMHTELVVILSHLSCLVCVKKQVVPFLTFHIKHVVFAEISCTLDLSK